MSAIDRTKALRRCDLKLSQLVKRDDNPNKMSKRAFDLLCDNYERTGLTDPILCRPLIGETNDEGLTLHRIVGGHHRYDAAVYIGFEDVPCTILPDDFDEHEETFQVLRMNSIRGDLDPMAFVKIYERYQDTYSQDVIQELFGFSDDKAFAKLIAATVKQIEDPTMKLKFKEAAKEVKTIDGLAKILNEIFTKYGDTLPYGFLIFDHAGRKNVWLRTSQKTLKAMNKIGARCLTEKRTVDDVVGAVLQLIADGKLDGQLGPILAKAPEVAIPHNFPVIPTVENLAGPSGKANGIGAHL